MALPVILQGLSDQKEDNMTKFTHGILLFGVVRFAVTTPPLWLKINRLATEALSAAPTRDGRYSYSETLALPSRGNVDFLSERTIPCRNGQPQTVRVGQVPKAPFAAYVSCSTVVFRLRFYSVVVSANCLASVTQTA
jgi:hypothetical protein